MALTSGTRIGNYEIDVLLGEGGMGQVYRARDTRLDRVVAIKSVPEAFARSDERLARFEREAKLLASLNHPGIAGIYGLEDVGGQPYLVLEYVAGETLAQRLARGPLSLRETLEIGCQIAAATEAAHERGIVHRDLKPGNVMLTASRNAKVLDFGLAKASPPAPESPAGLSATPTAAMSATRGGIILGTAPYMSPEQARGQPVDRRTDVWAFGCLLYECLTGSQAFLGETTSDVIARILERDPDWSAIPASAPGRLRDVVRRCLTKDVAERPRDIGDLGRELSVIASELGSVKSPAAQALPSLAVLYFENLADDKESEYFCSGITEDILTDLSKIQGLRVASRNAVARYRGALADIPRIAAELGVSAVLEGSVRRAGDRVRITSQLVSAADGFHLWAERFDRTLDDVFAVQEEIASSIASAMRVTLTPAESRNLLKDRPNDVRAYDLYLKGRQAYGHYRDESFREALALFQRAISIDPGYALAWAGIADCHGQMLQWEVAEDPEESARLGLEAAERAVELNPRLPEAYKARALVLMHLGDLEGSRAANIKALEANPRFTPALVNLAVCEFCRANLAAAERSLRRALESDPQETFATGWLGLLCQVTRREEETLALAQRVRKLSDDPFYITWSHQLRACLHLDRCDCEAAEQSMREALGDDVIAAEVRCIEAAIAARQGRDEEARSVLHDLESVPLGAVSLRLLAEVAVRLGEPDRAQRLLGRKMLEGVTPVLVRLYPDLHPLLDRPPFAPRRCDLSLAWPLEAPMIDAVRHGLFKDVRVESGIPSGSDVIAPR